MSGVLRHGGHALVSRAGHRDDLRALCRMGRELETWGGCAVVFPEGTRSRDGRVLPYRSSALKVLTRETRLPLLPVSISGTWEAADLPAFIRNMPGLPVSVGIGEPIPPERYEGRLEEALQDIRAWTRGQVESQRG